MRFTTCITILTCTLATSALRANLVEESAAGFRYEVPDTWQRLPNRKKISDPRLHLDTLYLKSERRLAVPCGWPAEDKAKAQESTEKLFEATFNVRILERHRGELTSKSGIPITRIWCATSGPDPANILIYEFDTREAIVVTCVCPLEPGAEKEGAAVYDRLFKTVELITPEHLAELPAQYHGKWYFDLDATARTQMSVAQSESERIRLERLGHYLSNNSIRPGQAMTGDLDVSGNLMVESGARFNQRYEILSMIRSGDTIFAEVLATSDLPGSPPMKTEARISEKSGSLTLATWVNGELGNYAAYRKEPLDMK